MQSLKIHNSKKETFELVKKAAKKIGLVLEDESISKGLLCLYSDGNFFSFGNKIDVMISTNMQSDCLINVSSRSSAKLQIIDWGTNDELEQLLIEEIQSLIT